MNRHRVSLRLFQRGSLRKAVPFLCYLALLAAAAAMSSAQNTDNKVPPVIDVHVHAMDGSFPGVGPMCPFPAGFAASDPRAKEEPFGWVKQECSPMLYPAQNGQYMQEVLAEMERLNVTAVVFGEPKSVKKWKDAAPARVIPGTSFTAGMGGGSRASLEDLRNDFARDGFKVMGEIGSAVSGNLSQRSIGRQAISRWLKSWIFPLASTWAPAAGPRQRRHAKVPRFHGQSAAARGSSGATSKTAPSIMHAGYPMIDNLLTLLQANSHVYVDVAG